MFRDWQEDNEKILRDSFNHDASYWKLKKLMGSYDKYSPIAEIIRKNFEVLKEIFIGGTVDSQQPPDFKRNPFFKFMEKAGVTDKRVMTVGIIDTYFVATNFEEIDQDNNADTALCRFEFMEILVRIAKGKYIETGLESNMANALTTLL